MCWRKWLVRGLVFTVLGAFALGGVLYQRWTNPAAVRRAVLARLRALLPGAQATLDAASMRLFGGIVLSELRLARGDDPERADFAYFPSVTLYPDKEHLLDGHFGLRKVELHRPRLRLVRGGDGRWNLDGLAALAPPQTPFPLVVVNQGTLVIEDHRAGTTDGPVRLEVTDVSLRCVNDPLATVTVEAAGRSELLGPVQLRLTWQRDTRRAAVAVQAPAVCLGPALQQRLAAYKPEACGPGVHVEGKADVRAEFAYDPSATPPLTHDVRCRLTEGKVGHPQLPLPLEDVAAALRCADGRLTLERLRARAGAAEVEAHGSAALPRPDQDFAGVLTVRHLPLDRELFARLPQNLSRMEELYEPAGPAGVTLTGDRRAGQWHQLHCLVRPEQVHVCFKHFPYPLERLTGAVEMDVLRKHYRVDVVGQAGAQPVSVSGFWKGEGTQVEADFAIRGKNIALDETLLKAIPETCRKLAESFHATGLGDLDARVRRTPGVETFQHDYRMHFHDAAVRWEEFSYPLEHVSGTLEIHPRRWEFRDFRGRRNGGEVFVSGRALQDDADTGKAHGLQPVGSPPAAPCPVCPGYRLELDINGRDVGLDADLLQALGKMPNLVRTWQVFQPAGRIHFTAKIDRPAPRPGLPPPALDMDVAVDAHGCAIEPLFFKYRLTDLSGQFRYAKNRVEVRAVKAQHDISKIYLAQGTVELTPGGGYLADLQNLLGQDILPDDRFVGALPPALKALCTALDLKDKFTAQTRLVVAQAAEPGSPPDIWWDGQMWLTKAHVQAGVPFEDVTGCLGCVGRHNGLRMLGLVGNLLLERASLYGQPFRQAHSRLEIKEQTPDVLTLGLKAPIFGGDVSGEARLEMGSTLRYEVNLYASQIRLEEFGRHNLGPNPPQLKGLAEGRLYLTGQGSGVQSLEGNGSLDVPKGWLYKLPLLLDLIKFLGLRWPDQTAFEEAHATFGLHGDRVTVNRLDLLGAAVSRWGKGEAKLDGTDLQLDFYPGWARVEQVLPPVIRSLPPAISKNLLKIEVRGKVGSQPGDLQFHKKLVPMLVDPLLQMRDRVLGPNQPTEAPKAPRRPEEKK
jgi:hypothetical protein